MTLEATKLQVTMKTKPKTAFGKRRNMTKPQSLHGLREQKANHIPNFMSTKSRDLNKVTSFMDVMRGNANTLSPRD